MPPSKGVTFAGFQRRVASFRVAGVALRDIQTCFLTCRKFFVWQAQYFRDVFRRCIAVFVAGAALWRPPHFTLHSLHFTLHFTQLTLHTLHFTLHSLHSTLYTPHSILCTPHAHATLYSTQHSTRYTPHSTHYTLHFALHTVHSKLYTLHSTLYIYTLHSTPYTPHSTLHTPQITLYTPHSTLYTLHSNLHTLHSIFFSIPQSTVHWYGNRGKCTRLFKKMFHKRVLRGCIRVRGLHLVFPISITRNIWNHLDRL